MPQWTIFDLQSEDTFPADDAMVERSVGVEVSCIRWAVEQDGLFENNRWRVEPYDPTAATAVTD